MRGRLWFLDRDNLNTDGIYAGKHTYNDNLTTEQMAAVIFENYDPGLRANLRAGDVIVSGLNFGTGSSREQAATALKHAGIPCVIAASFSETYKRNAFNNGFVCFECPALVEHLRQAKASGGAKSIVAGDIAIDYKRSVVAFAGREFPFPSLSPVAQELVVAAGAENGLEECLHRRQGGGLADDGDQVTGFDRRAVVDQDIGESVKPRIAHGKSLEDGAEWAPCRGDVIR